MTISFTCNFGIPLSDAFHNEVHVSYGVPLTRATKISNMQRTVFQQTQVFNSFDQQWLQLLDCVCFNHPNLVVIEFPITTHRRNHFPHLLEPKSNDLHTSFEINLVLHRPLQTKKFFH
jgi:hypothetical protein